MTVDIEVRSERISGKTFLKLSVPFCSYVTIEVWVPHSLTFLHRILAQNELFTLCVILFLRARHGTVEPFACGSKTRRFYEFEIAIYRRGLAAHFQRLARRCTTAAITKARAGGSRTLSRLHTDPCLGSHSTVVVVVVVDLRTRRCRRRVPLSPRRPRRYFRRFPRVFLAFSCETRAMRVDEESRRPIECTAPRATVTVVDVRSLP